MILEMGSFSEEGIEQFFDTRVDLSSGSDLGSDSKLCDSFDGVDSVDDCVLSGFGHDLWVKNLESVSVRRRRFMKWMGVDGGSFDGADVVVESIERITEDDGAVLGNSFLLGPVLSSSQSVEVGDSYQNSMFEDRIKELDDATESVVQFRSRKSLSLEELRTAVGSSPFIQRVLSGFSDLAREEAKNQVKRSWFSRLKLATRISHRHGTATLKPNDIESTVGQRMRSVKVHTSKKRSKELSSLYTGQEFPAHEGSILTMKFSLDGQYLATGGEDGVVRVWNVIEDDTTNQFDFSGNDPLCLYFTINQQSEIASLDVNKEKIGKTKHKSANLNKVLFPPKVFRVLEKPLHEFCGHSDEVLSLCWSRKKLLLSSSADKTVRLWQVGTDQCLRIFHHNNYVSCVDFNPVDDNYFISGSIDGKVRIWEVHVCQVVDYTDSREIISAVCYRPDGKGVIVGSLTGFCFFYDIIDSRLQLNAQVCLQGKNKLQGKRITGFEFCPSDPSKVIVTSADSVVRILSGMDTICKFRAPGIRSAANQLHATFTSDGKHIISTGEDSNINIWNYTSQERNSRVKNVHSSEGFMSPNASIAIPWHSTNNHQNLRGKPDHDMVRTSPDCFHLPFLDLLMKGSATWPEEKLPSTNRAATPSPTKGKCEYNFFKNAYQNLFSSPHLWGLVIVTAGWDGRIRTYLNYGLPLRL